MPKLIHLLSKWSSRLQLIEHKVKLFNDVFNFRAFSYEVKLFLAAAARSDRTLVLDVPQFEVIQYRVEFGRLA
jgi:hypothetical protein